MVEVVAGGGVFRGSLSNWAENCCWKEFDEIKTDFR